MRLRIAGILFLFIYLLSFGPAPGALGQTPGSGKYALIFAIGNYPETGGWPKISSVQDTVYIKNMLLEQDFPERNITIVTDGQATIEGIGRAFSELIDRVHKGDVVVIHFSSHGEQVEADNNNKIDGLDECIVTFNAVSPFKATDFFKDQANYLRGHVIGGYLRRLRVKLGKSGDVVVFMDNCHSGGGTRGGAKIRGGAPPFVSATFDPRRHIKSDSSLVFRDELQSGTDEQVARTDKLRPGTDEHSLASYEVFSATRPEELDFETTDERTGAVVGSLSYAMCRAFERLRSGDAAPTYRMLFAKIQSIMNVNVPQQHPLLEGNGADRVIFGGQFLHQLPYIELASIDKVNRQVTLRQGAMMGLETGARIAIYTAGTRDTARSHPLATGTIVSAGNFSATAALDGDLSIGNTVDGWAFITERVYKIEPIRLQFRTGTGYSAASSFSPGETAAVKKYLEGLSIVQFGDDPELILVKGRQQDSIKVNANGYLFSTVHSVATDPSDLKEKLEAYARYKFLQTLSGQEEGVQVEVRLVPLVNNRPDTAALQSRMVGNRFEFYENDTLTLWIKNTGRRDAYVNILDLQPDGVINPVLPNSALRFPIYSQDLKILAGQEYFLPAKDAIVIGPPDGTEVYKVFASDAEIDLEELATTRGGSSRSLMKPIEQLIRNSYRISRGGATTRLSNADATTSEFIYIIKPKNHQKN